MKVTIGGLPEGRVCWIQDSGYKATIREQDADNLPEGISWRTLSEPEQHRFTLSFSSGGQGGATLVIDDRQQIEELEQRLARMREMMEQIDAQKEAQGG